MAIARRVSPATRTVAPARAAARAPASSGFRGAEGLRRMQEEEENQAARREAAQMNANMPFRYRRNPGESGQVIVVDDAPDWFRYEHNLRDRRSNKWSIFCACLGENALCPVCREAERPAYFAMFLTVIDLSPYEDKHGNVIEWSKKLLVVKAQQQKKFTRYYKQHGSLRGMLLNMQRDGEKDPAIGNDIELEGFVSEEDMAQYEVVVEYQDRQGATKTREVIGHEPFDYDALFPMPTEQQLRAIVGGSPTPGSADEEARELGHATRRSASRSDAFDEDTEAAEPQRRVAARPAVTRPGAAPAGRVAVRPAVTRPAARPATRLAPEDDPSAGADPDAAEGEEVYEEEEAPPPRRPAATTVRRAVAAPAPVAPQRRPAAVVRRAPVADPEEELPEEGEVEEDAPPARGGTLAQRRQQLRRG